MKTLRYVLLSILITLTLFSIGSIILTLFETAYLPFMISKEGFIIFLNHFADFKNLYTATIAVMSVYYWIYQMDNMNLTNSRIEGEIVEKKKENTLVESRYFYNRIQPQIRDFFDKINSIDNTLLSYTWDYSNFNDQSVHSQNSYWEIRYEIIRNDIEKDVNAINFELESFSSNILHGNIYKELAFELIGEPFCVQIKVLFPFIAGYRSKDRKIDYFNNIVTLFKDWNLKSIELKK